MVQAKELRVFVYLLVFFPAIGFEPVESSMVFQRRSSNERPQLNLLPGARKKKGLDSTPHCSRVVPHPSTERAQTALTPVFGWELVDYAF